MRKSYSSIEDLMENKECFEAYISVETLTQVKQIVENTKFDYSHDEFVEEALKEKLRRGEEEKGIEPKVLGVDLVYTRP